MSNNQDYHPYKIDLSDAQMKKFAQGKKIRVKHSSLVGPDVVHLSTAQLRKIEIAKRSGKGVDLILSSPQLDFNVRHGSGRFTNFFKKIGNKVKDGALSVGQKLGKVAIGGVHSGLSNVANRVVPDGLLRRLVQSGLSAGNNLAQDELYSYLEGLKQSRHGAGLNIQFTKPVHRINPIRITDVMKNINRPQIELPVGGNGLYLAGTKRGQGLYLPRS